MNADNEIPFVPEGLASFALRDVRRAEQNLASVRAHIGDDTFFRLLPFFRSGLKQAADPDMALNHLERFTGAFEPGKKTAASLAACPAVFTQLLVLFGASRFLAVHCIATAAETLRSLCDQHYLAFPAEKEMLEERLAFALSGCAADEQRFQALRLFRKRELTRIAFRDLLGRADLSETVGELSHLAEVCLQTAYMWILSDLDRQYGRPLVDHDDRGAIRAGFAVIGMGKLGGRELNFSSDIDLMYVYEADGETEGIAGPAGPASSRITNHQYFIKLGEKLSAAIGQKTGDGFVFRVDLRLRPEGQRGPLAQSLGGYEIYYESWGQTWERSALIKARFVAGDEEVGKEFLSRIAPFVYRKYLDFSAIAEIRDMKMKINREVQQKGRSQRDVKLGYGGIREIEFLVQALQLIYGGRDRALRVRGTMRALHVLAQKGLLTYQEAADLMKAYVFLRTVEHRLQMLNDLQTQTLPSDESELQALARRSGLSDAEMLLKAYAGHTRTVRTIYDKLLSQEAEHPDEAMAHADVAVLLDPSSTEQEATGILDRSGFRDPGRAYRNIILLRDGQAFLLQTPRSRRVFSELFPMLFQEIASSADPDMALNHMESYLAVQGSWDSFHSFIRQDARLLKLMVSVFANSEYFSRMLVRTPALLEELLVGAGRSASLRSLRNTLSAAIARERTVSDKLDALRRFKHLEELRVGMADLAGELSLPAVSRRISHIAEACLDAALGLAFAETAKRFGGTEAGKGLAIMGAGKLGGRELIYGSDLDILFVYDESRSEPPLPGMTVFERFSKIAEKAISYLTTMTREGSAYRVDTRLRPTGSKGTLVQSIEAYRSYFAGAAVTWERQALVNMRFVAGDRVVGNDLAVTMKDLLFRNEYSDALAADILAMRKRMEDELGKEDEKQYNIKQGTGGLVDIEFLVQYLQLRYGREKTRLQVPGTFNALRALRREGVIAQEDAELLCSAYLFLRRLESRLRIVTNQSKSSLIRDAGHLRTLARRMGYADDNGDAGKKLMGDYEHQRTVVRSMFEKVLAR